MFSGGQLEPRQPTEIDQLLPMPVLLLRAVAKAKPEPATGNVPGATSRPQTSGEGGGEAAAAAAAATAADGVAVAEGALVEGGGGGEDGGDVSGEAGGAGGQPPAADAEPIEFDDLPVSRRRRLTDVHTT